MNFNSMMMYTSILSAICIATPFIVRRIMAGKLTGTFGSDMDKVLRNGGIGAIVSGVIVFWSVASIPADAHISTAARSWFSLPVMVQAHIVCAIVSLVIGPIVLWRKKGDRMHKLLGRVWVAGMYGLSLTGIPMWLEHKSGPLIIFSIITLISLTLALRAAFKRDIRTHLRFMLGSYIGLLVALVFAMIPGRVVANWVIALFA
ncbi:DUF2306 domain-containing protein [Burkholderiaceae bacterium DAT-1]|nr:DUF2306 domain-containing protein [Burkholderiaceae bacterium DAT-1]